MNAKLSIIVPCYNEEESIEMFYDAMEKIKKQMPLNFEYWFIDDGSTDHSLKTMRKLNRQDKNVHYLSFSKNFGKEAALYAGLQHATGDYVTVMDVDLQDPPELLPEMYHLLVSKRLDCVGTRRTTRTGEPKLRSFFAKTFYKLINSISNVKMVDGARDYRLMNRSMVNAVLQLCEFNRFSKGIFEWVGFKTEYIPFENQERQAGTTSWSFWKLFNYSIDGIINFSEIPLDIASIVGALTCLGSILTLIFIVIRALCFGDSVNGWPSLVSFILFLGGIQLLCLGIIGKYIGKIFLETKRRPIYLIKESDAYEL
ncbi:glycosyltransferase family 2 protein [Atopobacter phocae]|uniref:glycosyltransferase family 2 protein n=1 Tax=Atopobacter phocae TaxID=136492 RepID=UPI000470FFCB|nr:glycosyltransferase family 2 protein [Atopobacter phocae]